MAVLRKYQEKALNKLMHSILDYDKIPVLASCPGSGKTLIMTKIMEALIKFHNCEKVIVFAENMDFLRVQNYDKIKEEICEDLKDKIYLLKSWGDIFSEEAKKANIIVTLPATIGKNTIPFKTDLLIVDEAHHGVERTSRNEEVEETRVKKIVKRNNIKKQLYLTGTPAIYNLKNQISISMSNKECYDILAISMSEIYKESLEVGEEWFADTRFYIAASDIVRDKLRNIYNDAGDVNNNFKLSRNDAEHLLNVSLEKLVRHQFNAILIDNPELVNRADFISRIKKWTKVTWGRFFKRLGKTMWVCHNQNLGKFVCDSLNQLGVKSVLSCQDEGDNSKNIELFRHDKSIQCLVVVNKGSIGFDMLDLKNIVDLTGTRNINRIYQLYARIIRPHRKIKIKNYFKIGFEGEDEITKDVMEAALCLCGENIKIFNLRNTLDLPIVRKLREKSTAIKRNGTKGGKKVINLISYEGLSILPIFHMIEHSGEQGYEVIARTTLKETLVKYGKWNGNNADSNIIEILKHSLGYLETTYNLIKFDSYTSATELIKDLNLIKDNNEVYYED